MTTKLFEIRDRGTCIPVMAMRTEPANAAERQFFARGGWNPRTVLLARMDSRIELSHDSFHWKGDRTLGIAHRYINQYFDELENCTVVDVEYILGEKPRAAKSEIFVKEKSPYQNSTDQSEI